MDLKDIASVSGKGGLFRVLKPTRTGVILETIDDQKKRSMAGPNSRVSILKEISIYTTSDEQSVLLEDVFKSIHDKFGKKIELTSKSSEGELLSFLEEVVPDYDEDRVYPSDIKKLVSWYKILCEYYPEVIVPKPEKADKPKAEKETKEKSSAEEKKEEKKASTSKPKATAAKKDAKPAAKPTKSAPKTAKKTASK